MSHTKLLSPHMAIITALGSFDLNNTTGLQRFAGAAAAIPLMKLSPDHVPDFLAAIDAQAKATEVANQRYWKSAVGYLKIAREEFVQNNKTAQNGVGHAESSAGAEVAPGGRQANWP